VRALEKGTDDGPQAQLYSADWWDYTTIDDAIIRDAAAMTPSELVQLSRPGFTVIDLLKHWRILLAEALEYIEAWRQSTPTNPSGICGPIGPHRANFPLVAQIVNAAQFLHQVRPFLGHGRMVSRWQRSSRDHPLSFERADRELCFNRIRPDL
jgi:glucosamine-6-phosphate deaminase